MGAISASGRNAWTGVAVVAIVRKCLVHLWRTTPLSGELLFRECERKQMTFPELFMSQSEQAVNLQFQNVRLGAFHSEVSTYEADNCKPYVSTEVTIGALTSTHSAILHQAPSFMNRNIFNYGLSVTKTNHKNQASGPNKGQLIKLRDIKISYSLNQSPDRDENRYTTITFFLQEIRDI
jgi:hypothetical protein